MYRQKRCKLNVDLEVSSEKIKPGIRQNVTLCNAKPNSRLNLLYFCFYTAIMKLASAHAAHLYLFSRISNPLKRFIFHQFRSIQIFKSSCSNPLNFLIGWLVYFIFHKNSCPVKNFFKFCWPGPFENLP